MTKNTLSGSRLFQQFIDHLSAILIGFGGPLVIVETAPA